MLYICFDEVNWPSLVSVVLIVINENTHPYKPFREPSPVFPPPTPNETAFTLGWVFYAGEETRLHKYFQIKTEQKKLRSFKASF